MKVAIIGAGPAGLTAAYKLSQQNINVDVYESSDSVGGMARTIKLWGQKVDIGPHRFFSREDRVNKLWFEIIKDDCVLIRRLTRIYYKKRFFFYPLRAWNALYNLGTFEALRCFWSYGKQKIKPCKSKQLTFENWIVGRFGQRLYEIFFKSYSEKLWGLSGLELESEFAMQRIKKLSLYEALKNIFSRDPKNEHRTLVDVFAYPKHGSGVVYERMATEIRRNGNQFFLNTPVNEILVENSKAIGLRLQDGTLKNYDHIISTMPLTLMVKSIKVAPTQVLKACGQLQFRNTIIVYLRVDSENLFPDQWLYIHTDDLKMGRITNFRNWSPELYGSIRESVLAIEYWANDDDKIWNESEVNLVELAKKEIHQTGLIGYSRIIEGKVLRIKRCYPVYKLGYREHLSLINNYLKTIDNLYPIGRYGSFKYNNQDHSILMGLLVAEKIAGQSEVDFSTINSGDEYQEGPSFSP